MKIVIGWFLILAYSGIAVIISTGQAQAETISCNGGMGKATGNACTCLGASGMWCLDTKVTEVHGISVNGEAHACVCTERKGASAPSNLSYSKAEAVYAVDVPITPNTPKYDGEAPTSWSISRSSSSYSRSRGTSASALPAGLVIGNDGVISGTPKVEQAAVKYTVTAANNYGASNAEITIAVGPAPPSNLIYSNENPVYTLGTTITPNKPTVTGKVDSFSLSGLLLGFKFDKKTGILSGKPLYDFKMNYPVTRNFTFTATNKSGATTKVIAITINPGRAPASD
jgi:hypothetical protein